MIVKNLAIDLSVAGNYPLNLAQTNNDPGVITNTWTWVGGGGPTATSWNQANNWSPASVPGIAANIGVNVVIPNRSNQPTQDVSGVSINNITINPGATLSVNANNTLTIAGSFYNNGTFSASNGTVFYTGTNSLIGQGQYYNLDASATTTPTLSPVGTIGISNTFSPGSSSYTFTGSTITFNGSGAQNVPTFAYFNNVNFNANTGTALITLLQVQYQFSGT